MGDYRSIQVPCGQCIGCRLDYSKMWAMRCYHESRLHKHNCFITLTYDDEHVPWSSVTGEQTLVKRDLQLFWKSLRKKFPDDKIRYFACGEYGDTTFRPHYHAIIFGIDFADKLLYKRSGLGFNYYISPLLAETWKAGNSTCCDVSFDTCAYVARYVVKKLSGELGKEKYEGIEKEFCVMSRRPGIGKDWICNNFADVYPYDEVVTFDNGRKRILKPARYYDSLYDIDHHAELEVIKAKRLDRASRCFEENAVAGRMDQREEFKKLQTQFLKRSVE